MHGNRIPGHPRGPRAPAKLKATVVDIAKLVVGVFEGLGTKTNLNDITGCIEDTETIWSDVETAVSDFGTFDYDHIKAGIQELGKAVYLIPTDVKLCKAIPSDVAKLEDMAKIFLHPTQLVVEVAKAIWVNGVDILTELHKAVDDYNEAKYYDMGYQIGEAVAQVFFNGDQAMNHQSFQTFDSVVDDVIAFAKFTEGLVEGVAIEASLGDITGCITDAETAVGDIERAAQDFAKEDYSDIKKGLEEMGNLIKLVPSAIKTCESIPQDISELEQMAEVFTNPWELAWKVGKNLIVNGVEIIDEFSHAVVDYDNQDWKDMGKYTGEALVNIFLKGSYNYRNNLSSDNLANVAQTIIGFLEGVAMEEKLDNLDTCLVDGETLWGYYQDAEIQCKQLSFSSIKKCVQDMGAAAKLLPSALKACEGAPADLKKLEDMAKVFLNPVDLVYNVGKAIFLDGTNIYHEVTDGVSMYEKSDYLDFGKDFGLALSEVFLGGQTRDEDRDVEEIVLMAAELTVGFLDGVATETSLQEIEKCIEDPITVYNDFKTAFADFETWDFTHIREGFALIGQAIGLIRNTVSACTSVGGDIAQLEKLSAVFENPESLVVHVGQAIIFNGVDMYRKVSAGVADFKTQDYFDGGKMIGEAAAELTIEQSALAMRTKDERNAGMRDFLEGLFFASFSERELGNAEKVKELIHNTANSWEEHFEAMYLISWLAMNMDMETSEVYMKSSNVYTEMLGKVMDELKKIEGMVTAQVLGSVIAIQKEAIKMHNVECELLMLKLVELFAGKQYYAAGTMYAHLLHSQMEALA